MDLVNLIIKIRKEKKYSYRSLADLLNFSSGYINDVEKRRAQVSRNLLEAYAAEVLPETTNDNVSLADIYPIRVYDFISNSSGKVNFEEYEIIEFPFDKEDKEQIMNNSFVFKILGDNVQRYFFLDFVRKLYYT